MNPEIIKAAADWWAALLRTPPKHDTGDAKLDQAANTYHVNYDPLPESAIEAFSGNLRTLIKFYYEQPDNTFSKMAFRYDDFLYLNVDYHPCLTLKVAAYAINVDLEGRLPLKTKMWIREDKVEVAQGYGAPIEVICHSMTK